MFLKHKPNAWHLMIISFFMVILVMDIDAQTAISLINEVEINPSGSHTAVAYSDGSVLLIDNLTLNESTLKQASANSAVVTTFAWRPDGMALAGGDDFGDITIWDTNTLQSSVVLARNNVVISLDWMSDGTRLLAGYYEAGAVLWDVTSSTILFETPIIASYGIDLNPNENTFVMTDWQNIGIWDLSTGNNILTVETGNWETFATWNSTGDKFFSWSVDLDGGTRAITIRDGATGNIIRSMDTSNALTSVDGVSEADWSTDDQYIFIGSLLGKINIWNANTGQFVNSIPYAGQIFGLDILPDNSEFLFGGVPSNGQDATLQRAPVPSAATQSIAALTLVNATTDQDIRTLTNNDTIDIATTPEINIRANTSSATVGSVGFDHR